MVTLKMKSYQAILTEQQQKISALSSGRIYKYEYLTGEEILLSDQSRIIEQSLHIWKTNKNNWRSRGKINWSFKSFKTRGK